MSLKVTNELQAGFEAAGLEGIIREDRNSWWGEDLAYLCQQMYYLGVKSGGANLLLWGGQVKDRESADALAGEWLQGMEQEIKDGLSLILLFDLCSEGSLCECIVRTYTNTRRARILEDEHF
jgi:hypothetical protein